MISKLIDGKFPNYVQVIPKENQKKLEVDVKSFLNSVDRVIVLAEGRVVLDEPRADAIKKLTKPQNTN